ncbi:MAG: UDP-forming cellulose synthase catalytic subunit, partial [Alphaproteobacteria bacterium]|nr:UDP-forming cellulose synthase catalytic subunit [Alphaproteobacteria bacterium]
MTQAVPSIADRLTGPGWIALAALAAIVAALPTARAAQAWLPAPMLALMAVLLIRGPREIWRYAFLGLAVFLSLRYVFWRTANTISYHDAASFAAALLLYAAELYAVALYFLSAFVNARPLRRPVAPRIAPAALPTVDILIPTYDEPIDILRVTLVAACRIRYPGEKRRVYLLDDGGTDQKRTQADPVAAEAARYRQRALVGLCRAVGAHYLTRPRNEHAKAGNLNAALPRTRGDLVLVVDADHVPTPDILERSVGYFVEDPDLALVQTPHFFVAPDPIEKNLGTFRAMPGEYEMFYRVIQPGLDFWNASLFCGSAAILSRRHLAQLGGFAATTVTEDAETSLALHARGLKSRYIPEPMVAGLVPDTFEALVRQRTRWAQGMTQLFIRDNPLLKRGLSLPQRLCYLAGMLFWQFPFARVVFLLAPLAFLLLGLRIYDANLWDVAVYALPHLVASALVSRFLFAGARWPFVSSVYETMLALFTGRALLSVYRRPLGPRFRVTPKGHTTATAFIAPLARPFYVLLALYALAVPAAIYRALTMPDDLDTVCITAAWGLFNLALLIVALGALYERKQRRAMPRVPAGLDAALVVGR